MSLTGSSLPFEDIVGRRMRRMRGTDGPLIATSREASPVGLNWIENGLKWMLD